MSRYFETLRPGDRAAIDSLPDGLVLVRVDRADYRWHQQKPYYLVRFLVLEPHHLSGFVVSGRLYCSNRAMWKLSWFLHDFGYDDDLLAKGEVDSRALVGLQGVVKVSYAIVRGMFVLNFDGFAPSDKWKDLSPISATEPPGSEVA